MFDLCLKESKLCDFIMTRCRNSHSKWQPVLFVNTELVVWHFVRTVDINCYLHWAVIVSSHPFIPPSIIWTETKNCAKRCISLESSSWPIYRNTSFFVVKCKRTAPPPSRKVKNREVASLHWGGRVHQSTTVTPTLIFIFIIIIKT